jgi:hypothetical protein
MTAPMIAELLPYVTDPKVTIKKIRKLPTKCQRLRENEIGLNEIRDGRSLAGNSSHPHGMLCYRNWAEHE